MSGRISLSIDFQADELLADIDRLASLLASDGIPLAAREAVMIALDDLDQLIDGKVTFLPDGTMAVRILATDRLQSLIFDLGGADAG
jgi:hypothetical protein